jgi:hypothetical protein
LTIFAVFNDLQRFFLSWCYVQIVTYQYFWSNLSICLRP